MMDRRAFLVRCGGVAGGALLVATSLSAQEQTTAGAPGSAGQQSGSSNLFDMDQGAAKTVRRPAKPNASRSMTDDERDALEHQVRCQCGCTLDVYTCRTTDFSCEVSPAMHRDVMALVEGGYSAKEIIDAFVGTYGERALMAPTRQGFNLAGYLVPFAALAAAGAALTVVLKKMSSRGGSLALARVGGSAKANATDDELARLQAAIRRDE